MATIYTLSDPITNEVRYVGFTSTSLQKRLWGHTARNTKTYCKHWIKSLKSKGFLPIIEAVEEDIDSEDISWKEQYWISQFKTWGFNLTNHSQGGEMVDFTPHVKAKMSESRKRYEQEYREEFLKRYEKMKITIANTPDEIKQQHRKKAGESIKAAWSKVGIDERRKRGKAQSQTLTLWRCYLTTSKGEWIKMFPSIKEAAGYTGLNKESIRKAGLTGRPVKGMYFRLSRYAKL